MLSYSCAGLTPCADALRFSVACPPRWIDTELFLAWIKKIFLKYVVPERPVLLLTDGHKTQM